MSSNANGAPPVRAVVLSGGGARGAYEAGVLRFLVEGLPRETGIQPRFDILGGTSVGAIHACFMAATADLGEERGPRLAAIWEDLRVDEVFRFTASDIIALPRRILGVRRVAEQLRAGQRPDRLYGLLDTKPLERLVVGGIPWKGIRKNLLAGRIQAVCVAATQIATGRALVFVERKERELPPWADQTHIRMQSIRLMPVHALASAAIPLLFPAVRVGARYYADGGLRLNTPMAPVVRLGANRILVIGLSHASGGDVSEALAQQRTEGFANPLFLFGKVLNALLLSPIDTDLTRMNFINEIIDGGEEIFGPDFLDRLNTARDRPIQRIHCLVIRPSMDLGRMAGEILGGQRGKLELSPFLRLFMRAFGTGAGPRESDLLSYLLFDADYARPLIELGYQDAAARCEELAQFFSD
ncbi:MAG: patatin-like phospholipase family protein [Proteobacteria bacterium]|nr:patatin-like phospholipase family protein [Pseudomonadota bacterium]